MQGSPVVHVPTDLLWRTTVVSPGGWVGCLSGARRLSWSMRLQVFEASGDGAITHPAVLKDRVTAPVSCSVAGLVELEVAGVRGAFNQAVRAATKRSEALG